MISPEKVSDLDTRLAWLKDHKVHRVHSVHLERRRVRCGREDCRRCVRGELHGPYYYLRFVPRPGPKRKRIRIYVRLGAVEKVRTWLVGFRAVRSDDRLVCRAIRALSV